MISALPDRHLVAFALCVLLAGGQTASRAQAPTGGEPVKVTFLTVGRDGRPILDLKPEEVQLRVDGRQRTLTSLDRVDATTAASGDAATPSGPALPAPFGTNVAGAGVDGRTTFLVIDDGSFRPGNERSMKQAIDQYLDAIPPSDRVAILTMPHATVRTDPTSPATVRQALTRVAGVGAPMPTDSAGRERYENDGRVPHSRDARSAAEPVLQHRRRGHASDDDFLFCRHLGHDPDHRQAGHLQLRSVDRFVQNVGTAAAEARAHV